jgi:hypothetical protein
MARLSSQAVEISPEGSVLKFVYSTDEKFEVFYLMTLVIRYDYAELAMNEIRGRGKVGIITGNKSRITRRIFSSSATLSTKISHMD